jgi:hypothetical protein
LIERLVCGDIGARITSMNARNGAGTCRRP